MQIEQVRKYVLSSLVCSVITLHATAVAGLGAALNGAGGARQGLFVMSILFELLAIAAVRLINRLRVATPWLLGAVVPAVVVYVVYYLIFGHYGH